MKSWNYVEVIDELLKYEERALEGKSYRARRDLGVIPIGDPYSVTAIIEKKLKQHVIDEGLLAYERLWEKM